MLNVAGGVARQCGSGVGDEGLAQFEACEFDFVPVDLPMPGMAVELLSSKYERVATATPVFLSF